MMLWIKTVYHKLVAKVNSSDTSVFVLKTNYDRYKSEIENKIPDTSGLVKKSRFQYQNHWNRRQNSGC